MGRTNSVSCCAIEVAGFIRFGSKNRSFAAERAEHVVAESHPGAFAAFDQGSLGSHNR
jgi:hypothetical protein